MQAMFTVILLANTVAEGNEKQAAKTIAKVQKLLRPLVQNGEIELKVTEEISDLENA
jgi:hypothetical protein